MNKKYRIILCVALIFYCLAIYIGITESIPMLQVGFKTDKGFSISVWSIIAILSWGTVLLVFSFKSTQQMQEQLDIEYIKVIFHFPILLIVFIDVLNC